MPLVGYIVYKKALHWSGIKSQVYLTHITINKETLVKFFSCLRHIFKVAQLRIKRARSGVRYRATVSRREIAGSNPAGSKNFLSKRTSGRVNHPLIIKVSLALILKKPSTYFFF
jgi:hypothetical protein